MSQTQLTHHSAKSRGETPNFLGLQRHGGHWSVFRGLLPFVWPAGRGDLRRNIVLAFGMLVLGKIITIFIPLLFKYTTDGLTSSGAISVSEGPKALALGILLLILAYGVSRVLAMVLNQIRDVLFTKVGQNAVRSLNNRTFKHLHNLSLRFHLERRTGGLSRIIERGTRGIDLILRMGILQLLPTFLELALVLSLIHI